MSGHGYGKGCFKTIFKDRAAYAARERRCRQVFESATGIDLSPNGVGAESAQTFAGYAKDHGGAPGDADYVGMDGALQVEVTGSNVVISENAALWVNVTKVRAAYRKAWSGALTVIVHEIPRTEKEPLVRCILLGVEFFDRMQERAFRTSETKNGQFMVVVPASDPAVMSMESAVARLRAWKSMRGELAAYRKRSTTDMEAMLAAVE